MTNETEDFSQYVNVGHNSKAEISELTKLAERQHASEQKVKVLEDGLELAKEELKEISEEILPAKMEEYCLTTYGTKSGISVEIIDKITATILVENRTKAYDWLENNGFGNLIKSDVVVAFNRKQITEAKELVKKLREEGKVANLERNVHYQTLQAFVRERLKDGKEVPADIFSVYRQSIAKVEI